MFGGGSAPLLLGRHQVWPPVVLAPMAGVTNRPFRELCASFGEGLFVAEMVSARALRFGDHKSWHNFVDFAEPDPANQPTCDPVHGLQPYGHAPPRFPAGCDPGRTARFRGVAPSRLRSLQLYATDPMDVAEAVRALVDADRVDHLDLNFGCPAPKITRQGGGAAIPLKPRLLAAIVRAAVSSAGPVPVSVKCRIGLDDTLHTFRDVGRVAEDEGCAWVTLHGRTALQHYSGQADWGPIAELKSRCAVPVLGNGDVFTAGDALAMMDRTGCDGVVIGRGCLGRPWLFAELEAAFRGHPVPAPPAFGAVMTVIRRHADALQATRTALAEHKTSTTSTRTTTAVMREFRKHLSWYAKGYRVGLDVRRRLGQIDTREDLEQILAELNPDAQPVPGAERMARGKSSAQHRVALPDGYLDRLDDDHPPTGADMGNGG